MTGDQQQPAAAATPGPEQRVAEIKERCEKATPGPWLTPDEAGDYDPRTPVDHEGCAEWPWLKGPDMVFAYKARADVPWLLDRLAAVEQERDTARTWSSLWKRTTTRYRRMLAIHRGRGWGTLAADNAALRSELAASRAELAWVRHSDACGQCGSHGVRPMCPIGYPLRDAWTSFQVKSASTPRTEPDQAQEGQG